MAPLCWRHHTLILALLSRGPLKEKEFQSIFSDVTGKSFERKNLPWLCCGTQWPYIVTKAEAVEEEEIDVNRPPPESLRRKRSRGSKQVQDESIGPSQGQPSTQTLRKTKLETLPAGEVDNNGVGRSTRRTTRTSARLHR